MFSTLKKILVLDFWVVIIGSFLSGYLNDTYGYNNYVNEDTIIVAMMFVYPIYYMIGRYFPTYIVAALTYGLILSLRYINTFVL